MACEWCELCGVDGGVIEVYTLQAIMSRRVILGAFVPESPTAKAVSMACGWCGLCGVDGGVMCTSRVNFGSD